MNKKQIIFLLIIFIAIMGLFLFLSSERTVVVKNNHEESIGDNHYASLKQEGDRFSIGIADKSAWGSSYKTSKADVYFNYGGETVVKTYEANKYGMIFEEEIPKGYELIEAKLYFKKEKIDYT